MFESLVLLSDSKNIFVFMLDAIKDFFRKGSPQIERSVVFESSNERVYKVSPEVRLRLMDWEVDTNLIDELQKIGEKFEYNHPEKRLERVLRGGLEVKHHPDLPIEYIEFKEYSDSTNLNDPHGECAELGRRFILTAKETENTRDIKSKHGRVKMFLVGGYSPSHFYQNEARHFWVGMLPEDKFPDNLHDMVLVDPSFRTITTLDRSDYSINTRIGEPAIVTEFDQGKFSSNRGIPSLIIQDGRISIMSAKYMIEGRPVEEFEATSSVLGISEDYRFGVSLIIGKNLDNQKHQGVISLYDANGDVAFYIARDHATGEILFTSVDGHDLKWVSKSVQDNCKSMILMTEQYIQ